MSPKAIRFLPPFMNFRTMTTWVDDHLKRRLHEAIGDLEWDTVECLPEAQIKQDRHDKITQNEYNWHENYYLLRLLRGCMFRSIITNVKDNTPTEYSALIKRIVIGADSDVTTDLELYIKTSFSRRMKEVLNCWSDSLFEGYRSHGFSVKLKDNRDKQREIIDGLTSDALNYVNLVRNWPLYVRAIERLEMTENEWLFLE